MKIYGNPIGILSFRMPYTAKELLSSTFRKRETFVDSLMDRIKSTAAAALVLFSGALLTLLSTFATPTFFAVCVPLHVLSRITSFEKSVELRSESMLLMKRVLKLHWIAIRVLPLFLVTASVNACFPLTKEQAFSSMDNLVKDCQLETIKAVDSKGNVTIGTQSEISCLDSFEEYLAALSSQKTLPTIQVMEVEYKNNFRY